MSRGYTLRRDDDKQNPKYFERKPFAEDTVYR